MAFKEKTAWLVLVALLLGFGVYFGAVAMHSGEGIAHESYFLLLLGVIIAITVAMVAVTTLLAIRSPGDARAPADERDRAIRTRAATLAYFVLLVGVLTSAGAAHFGIGLFGLLNALLAAIVIAECLRYGFQIIQYRRG